MTSQSRGQELSGKTAVITGAAGDIGAATARLFEQEGARLSLLDIDGAGLMAIERADNETILRLPIDLTVEEEVAQAAEKTLNEFGPPDVLFINAGMEQQHLPIGDIPAALFDKVIAVNLRSAFLTAKYFSTTMADGGSIVITSSIAALVGLESYAAYSASKAALVGLMRAISCDLGPKGIRCNTIHPGAVRSRMIDRVAGQLPDTNDAAAFYENLGKSNKLGRMVEPGDVAELALFLASGRSQMITGQMIAVHGGSIS